MSIGPPGIRRYLRCAASVLLAACLVPDAGAEQSLRCGNALISVGMVAAQVVMRCGQPLDRQGGAAAPRGRRSGGGAAGAGARRVERWTYDRGYGQFPALLTFEGGRLTSIELLTR